MMIEGENWWQCKASTCSKHCWNHVDKVIKGKQKDKSWEKLAINVMTTYMLT